MIELTILFCYHISSTSVVGVEKELVKDVVGVEKAIVKDVVSAV